MKQAGTLEGNDINNALHVNRKWTKKSFKAPFKPACFSSALLQVPFTLSDWTTLHNQGADKPWLPNNSCIPFRQVHREDRNARPSCGAGCFPARPSQWNPTPSRSCAPQQPLHFLRGNYDFSLLYSQLFRITIYCTSEGANINILNSFHNT